VEFDARYFLVFSSQGDAELPPRVAGIIQDGKGKNGGSHGGGWVYNRW
jgi:hypothetical protein